MENLLGTVFFSKDSGAPRPPTDNAFKIKGFLKKDAKEVKYGQKNSDPPFRTRWLIFPGLPANASCPPEAYHQKGYSEKDSGFIQKQLRGDLKFPF